MKKCLFIILTVVTFCVAACTKAEITNTESPQAVKINVTVADMEPGTKAVKTGWTTGDKINIWFDDVTSDTPHLIITFNGTTWDSGTIDPTAEAALKTDGTGTFKYLYEAGNDISKYSVSFGYMYDFPDGSIGSQGYYAPVLTVTSPGTDLNYTYDGSVLNLNLNEWWYMTNAQVVVTGLSGNPEDWYLKASSSNQWDVPADFRNRTGGGWEYGISDPASRGTSNGDGVAFYLRIPNTNMYNAESTSMYAFHTFTLGNASKKYSFTKKNTPIASAYAAANPSATSNEIKGHTFTAIKIAFASFTEVTP